MHELGKVDDSVSILGAQRRESLRRHHTVQGRRSEGVRRSYYKLTEERQGRRDAGHIRVMCVRTATMMHALTSQESN